MANQLWSDERITDELDRCLINTYDLDGHRDGSAVDYDATDMLMTRMRNEYEQRIGELEAESARLGQALAFAKSVILSGEPWTDACDEIIDDALKKARGE